MIGAESTFKLQNGMALGFDAGEFGWWRLVVCRRGR